MTRGFEPISKPRKTRMPPALDSLRRIAAQAPEPHRIAAFWALAMGKEIRDRTRVRLDTPGTVVVEVLDPEWLETLSGMKTDLLRRLNEIAGSGSYRVLEFRISPRAASTQDPLKC